MKEKKNFLASFSKVIAAIWVADEAGNKSQ
jgi:hypothetical protein